MLNSTIRGRFAAHLLGLVAVSLAPFAAYALEVVASLPTLATLAREVGGDKISVQALISPRQDPHYVDARPSLILQLNRADLLVVNGLELEVGWLPGLVRQARNGKINIGSPGYFDASTAVPLAQVPAQKIDRSMGDVHPGGNPHFASDPRSGAKIALALAAVLGRLDPANAAYFLGRAQTLAARLDKVAAEEQKRFAALPVAKRQVVVYHDSLVYFVHWLGLKQVATVEPRPGIPPNPQHVAQVLQAMRTTATKAIAQEEYYPRNTSQTLAQLIQGRVAVIPGGARFDDKQRYEDHVRAIAKELYDVLSAQ